MTAGINSRLGRQRAALLGGGPGIPGEWRNFYERFISVFQMSKTIIFEVKYYTLSTNKTPYFSTSAARFCRNKLDYIQCGQIQKSLLRSYPAAMRFFKKWDAFHLKDLTPAQYEEMQTDLEELKARYNFIYEELDETKRPYTPRFGFHRLAEWSKQMPKAVAPAKNRG